MKDSLKKRVRNISINLLIAIAAIIMTLLVLEIIIRIIPIDKSIINQVTSLAQKTDTNRSYSCELTGFSIGRPGVETVHKTSEFEYQVKLNSNYLREREISYQKPPGEFRILIIGPSWTFGWGVDNNKTVPYLLEQKLKELYPNRQIVVINAGVPGQWVLSNILFYLYDLHKYDPDVVIHMQAHDFGLQGFIDLTIVLGNTPVTMTTDDFFRYLYTKIKTYPVINKSQLLVFILERLRKTATVREYIEKHLNVGKTTRTTISASDFIQECDLDPSCYPIIKRMFQLFDYFQQLSPETIQASLHMKWVLDENLRKYRDDEVTRTFFNGIAEILYEFQGYLSHKDIKTFFFNVDGHALYSGKQAIADKVVADWANEALQRNNVAYFSFDHYLFNGLGYRYGDPNVRALFYPQDMHPNERGYGLLTELLLQILLKLQWIQSE